MTDLADFAAPPHWPEPLHYGRLELPSRFHLAPLAGYTNLPFRLSVRECGGLGMATTDLISARAIVEQTRKTLALLATCDEDRPLAVQIFGADPGEMCRAATWLVDQGIPSIDINMGCPVRKVVRTGGGSAMMCNTTNAARLVEMIVKAVDVPVTVKMRLGWDAENMTAPRLARAFEEVGVAAVTVHGRTREQGFGGTVNLDGIAAVVDAVSTMPVIGNGDVRNLADAQRMLQTGCDGIAIGRGALLNPWFFRQLDRWCQVGDPGTAPGYVERVRFMATHFRRLCDWRGDHLGCLQFRKIAAWYCKALRTGKAILQKLVMLDTPETFDRVIEQLLEQGPPEGWQAPDARSAGIAVPSGPIAHW